MHTRGKRVDPPNRESGRRYPIDHRTNTPHGRRKDPMKKLSITCLAPILALTACAVEPGAEDEPQYGEVENLVQSGNGTSLNGTSLNGTSLNGTSLNLSLIHI